MTLSCLCGSYQWSRPAPSITKPNPNVIIRLCDIECNFAAPLTDPSNAPFQKDMNAWAAISNRTYIWCVPDNARASVVARVVTATGHSSTVYLPLSRNYVTAFDAYIQPFPNWYVLGPNIQYFAAHGVRGIFEEGSYGTSGGETTRKCRLRPFPASIRASSMTHSCTASGDMDALKDYVMGRMLWNVTLNPDDLIEEFLSGYFGAAAPFIRVYMDTMHGAIADTSYYMHEGVPTDAPFLTPMAVITSAQAFQDALKVVTGVKKSRVDIAKISIYYTTLLRWDEMQEFAKNESIPWPLEETKQAAWQEFTRMWNIIGIGSTREGSCNFTCFKDQVFPSAQIDMEPNKTDDQSANTNTIVEANSAAGSHLKYMSYCKQCCMLQPR